MIETNLIALADLEFLQSLNTRLPFKEYMRLKNIIITLLEDINDPTIL
jgi:hypothetical protein